MDFAAFIAAHHGSVAVVFLAAIVVCGVGAAVFTEADVRADVIAALQRAGWKCEAAAASIGISVSRLSQQLNGHDPLTCIGRLALLEGFLPAFIEVSAPRFGITVVRNQDLAGILDELRGGKRMCRMSLPESQQERTA